MGGGEHNMAMNKELKKVEKISKPSGRNKKAKGYRQTKITPKKTTNEVTKGFIEGAAKGINKNIKSVKKQKRVNEYNRLRKWLSSRGIKLPVYTKNPTQKSVDKLKQLKEYALHPERKEYDRSLKNLNKNIEKVSYEGFESTVAKQEPIKRKNITEASVKKLKALNKKVLNESFFIDDEGNSITRKAYKRMDVLEQRKYSIVQPMRQRQVVDNARVNAILNRITSSFKYLSHLFNMTSKEESRLISGADNVRNRLTSMTDKELDEFEKDIDWDKFDISTVSSDGVEYYFFMEDMEEELARLADISIEEDKRGADELDEPDRVVAGL